MIQKIFLAKIIGGFAASYTGGMNYGCTNRVFWDETSDTNA